MHSDQADPDVVSQRLTKALGKETVTAADRAMARSAETYADQIHVPRALNVEDV